MVIQGFFPVSIHWDKKKIGIYLHHKPKVADSLDFCDFYPFTDLVLSMRLYNSAEYFRNYFNSVAIHFAMQHPSDTESAHDSDRVRPVL